MERDNDDTRDYPLRFSLRQKLSKLSVGAKIKARYSGRETFYPGRIARVCEENDKYDVKYDDGLYERNVQRHLIELELGSGHHTQNREFLFRSSKRQKLPPLKVGDKIKARYSGRETYYVGCVSQVRDGDTYDVLYDDGLQERNVKRHFIELLELTSAISNTAVDRVQHEQVEDAICGTENVSCPQCQKTWPHKLRKNRNRSSFQSWLQHHLARHCPRRDDEGDLHDQSRLVKVGDDHLTRQIEEEIDEILPHHSNPHHENVNECSAVVEQTQGDFSLEKEQMVNVEILALNNYDYPANAVDILSLQMDLLGDKLSLRSSRHEGNEAGKYIIRFLSQHSLTNGGISDLLCLIKDLCTTQNFESVQALPSTARSFLKFEKAEEIVSDGYESESETSMTSFGIKSYFIKLGADQVSFWLQDMQHVLGDLLLEDFPLHWAGTQGSNYCELNSGSWWAEASAKASELPLRRLLSIILYIDGISVDFFGHTTLIPIMMTIGNFKVQDQRRLHAKRLIGFIPHITEQVCAPEIGDLSAIRRFVMHEVIREVVREIQTIQISGGLRCYTGKNFSEVFCYPVLAYVVCDNKEAAALSHIKTGNTSQPCRFCHIDQTQMHTFNAPCSYKMRSGRTALESVRDKALLAANSIQPDVINNTFLRHVESLSCGNALEHFYFLFPPDMLHTILGGVVRYSCVWTLSIIKKSCQDTKLRAKIFASIDRSLENFGCGASTDSEFSIELPYHGICEIVKDVKVNRGGDEAESYVQHFETRKWISILISLACLVSTNKHPLLPDPYVHWTVSKGLHLVLNLYFELNRSEFADSNLKSLEDDIIPHTLTAFYKIYMTLQRLKNSHKHFRGIKPHLLLHYPAAIRRFGAPKLWDADSYESAHKEMVKDLFRQSSKRILELEKEILIRYVNEQRDRRVLEENESNRNKDDTAIQPPLTRHQIRAWRKQAGAGVDESSAIYYRFWSKGYPIALYSSDRWKMEDESTTRFKAHRLLRPHLLTVLKAYAISSRNTWLLRRLRSSVLSHEAGFRLHDHIDVDSKGYFEGFRRFSIYSNSSYGASLRVWYCRQRHDFVEVVIPKSKGGDIAGSPKLLRTGEDSAVARVIGILSYDNACGARMTLLVLQFLEKVEMDAKLQSLNISHMCIGRPSERMIAAYPVVTIKGAILGLDCNLPGFLKERESKYMLFGTQYLSRSMWAPAPTSQDAADDDLPFEDEFEVDYSTSDMSD